MGGGGAQPNLLLFLSINQLLVLLIPEKIVLQLFLLSTGTQVATSGGTALSSSQQTNSPRLSLSQSELLQSSYVVKDSGVKYVYDRFNDKFRYDWMQR